MAAQCDETAHLTAGERKARSSAKLAHPDRLAEAVAQYTDYEAIALWARPALKRGPQFPQEVARELRQRCPGYLDTWPKNKATAFQRQEWDELMLWIGDHCFKDAKTEGWFDVILIHVRSHPQAIRTMEFADHCDELWGRELPRPYPAFEMWRGEADSYVDVDRKLSET